MLMAAMQGRSAILVRPTGLLHLCLIANGLFSLPIMNTKEDFLSICISWMQKEKISKRSAGIMALMHFRCLVLMGKRLYSAATGITVEQERQISLLRIGWNEV